MASGSVAFYYAVNVLPRSGLPGEAVSILNQALTQARRRGDIFNVGDILLWRGRSQTLRGDLRAAVADLREATDISATHGMLVSRPYNVGFLAEALLEQGSVDEAARAVDEADFPEQLPLDQVLLTWFRLYRGRLRIETGNPERGSRSCSRWARPFGSSPLTIRAPYPGAVGPPKAFDCSIGQTKRACS